MASLSGGRVSRRGRWVPVKDKCPPPRGDALPPLAPDAPRLLRPFDARRDSLDEIQKYAEGRRVLLNGVAAEQHCGGQNATHKIDSRRSDGGALPPATCADDAATLSSKRVALLIGVHSAPGKGGRVRRDAIRSSWMKWPSVGRSVVVCFVVGTKHMAPDALASLQREAATTSDLVLLHDVADTCVLSLTKAYGWWRHSARLLRAPPGGGAPTTITHVAKVDDDSFVHVPNLERHLRALACLPRMLLGTIAFSGYSPSNYGKCAFSWSPKHSPYRKYLCAERGFHPPVPFATGPLQVLTSPLVDELARFDAVATFCARAEATLHLGTWDKSEDTALGWWLHHLPASEPITFVGADKRWAHNLGCYKSKNVYKPPSNASMLVHFLKKPLAFQYMWETLRERRPHDAARCYEMAGVD